MGKEVAGFDEPTFNTIFEGLQASGMKPGMFVFDQKWLGKYGELDPSPERFPHFDQCLEKVRSAGYRLGFWTAFLRCEDPRDLGLTPAHMLHKPDGSTLHCHRGLNAILPDRFYPTGGGKSVGGRVAPVRATV